jgi:hypothetical protein
MSYLGARGCFQDNNNYASPDDQPILWNISNGLNELTQAVQTDLHAIQGQLHQIIQLLQQRG